MQRYLHLWLIIIPILIFFTSCSKDPLQIDQIPFRELESSFYELADSTLEIAPAQLDLVKSIEEFSMVIDQSFGEILPGNIIWSSYETDRTDFIGRKVISVQLQGSDYILSTVPATMIQAYKSFYIDTDRPNAIQVRNDGYNISSFFTAGATLFSNALNSTLSAIGSGVEGSLDMAVSGTLRGQLIHPNTACNYLKDCNLSGNILPSGIDVNADTYFSIAQTTNVNIQTMLGSVGFTKFTLTDFGLDQLNLKFTSSSSVMNLANIEPGLNGLRTDTLTARIKGKTPAQLADDDGVELIYVPTPLTLGPAGTLYITVSPLLEMVGNVSLFFGLDFSSTKKINIEFGNIKLFDFSNNTSSTVAGVTDYEIRTTDQQGKASELSGIFKQGQLSAQLGASAGISFNGGFNIGVSVGSGEPNKAGIAAGVILPTGFSFGLTGEGVADFPIFPADKEPDFFGSLCANADVGILDFVFFTDSNFKIPGSDVFDYFLSAKDILPFDPPKYSLFDLAPEIETKNGKLCWESTCAFLANSEMQQFNVLSSLATSLEFEILLINPLLPNQEYFVDIIVDGTAYPYPDNAIAMGEKEKFDAVVTNFTTAHENLIISGDFQVECYIKETDGSKKCITTFQGNEAGIFDLSCDDSFWFWNSGIEAKKGLGPTQTVNYFTQDDLLNKTFDFGGQIVNVLAQLRSRISTISAIENHLIPPDQPTCVNPTGHISVESKGLVNLDKSYVWYSDQSGADGKPLLGMLEVTHDFSGGVASYSFEDIPITGGVAAALIQ